MEIPSTRSTYRQDIAFFCRSPVCSCSTAAYPATSCCSTSATRPAGGKSLQQGRRIGRILLSSVVLRSALAALPRIRQQAVAALLSPDWRVKIPSTRSTYRQDIAFFCRSPVCSRSTATYPATSCCSTSTTRPAGGKSLQQGRRIGRIFLSSVVLRSALAALPRIRQQAVAALLPPDWRRVRNPFNKVDVSAGYFFLLSFSGPLWQHCRVSGDKLSQHFCHQTGGWKIPSTRSTYRQDIAFFCRSPVCSCSTAAYPTTSCCSTSTTRPGGRKSLQQGRRIGRILLSSVVLRSALAALPRIRQQAVAALLPPDWRVENPFNKVDVSAGYCFLLSFSGLLLQHCRVSGNKLLQHFHHQTGGWKIPSTRSTYRQGISFCRHSRSALAALPRIRQQAVAALPPPDRGVGNPVNKVDVSAGYCFLPSLLRSALAALPRIRQQAVAALLPPDWRVRNPVNKVDVSAGYFFLLSFSGLLLQHCRVSGNKLLQHFCHQTIPSTRSTYRQDISFFRHPPVRSRSTAAYPATSCCSTSIT